MLLCFIVDTSRYVITRQQLLTAARYGTDLIVYQNFNEEQVKEEITNYLSSPQTQGRKLDKEKLSIKVTINRFPTINTYDANGNPLNLARILSSPRKDDFMKYNAYVEIKYELKLSKVIATIITKKDENGQDMEGGGDTLNIVVRSEVLKGTGIKKGHS